MLRARPALAMEPMEHPSTQRLRIAIHESSSDSDLLRVPLSTIDQGSASIGRQAADLLIKAITAKRKKPGRTILIEPTLIARESTR